MSMSMVDGRGSRSFIALIDGLAECLAGRMILLPSQWPKILIV